MVDKLLQSSSQKKSLTCFRSEVEFKYLCKKFWQARDEELLKYSKERSKHLSSLFQWKEICQVLKNSKWLLTNRKKKLSVNTRFTASTADLNTYLMNCYKKKKSTSSILCLLSIDFMIMNHNEQIVSHDLKLSFSTNKWQLKKFMKKYGSQWKINSMNSQIISKKSISDGEGCFKTVILI